MAEQVTRRPFRRPITAEWITRHPRYVRYMLREFSCIFIMVYTLLLVAGMKSLADGPAAYAAFLESLRSPLSVVFHLLALAFAAYHSVTWFALTPKALPLQVGDEFVAEGVISGAHYAVWAVLSVALLALAGAF